ncbi:hypothetical protein FOL46_009864 [Perkinsus olseni]|uniref:Uncharacterized protein n=1 Tax=Perkinsus olseni TaxID=32597 RepID=A0A7J6KZ67_PEROL|nr:hypothetical protein FOL46_009864 [Perkinsus olseni]
MAYFRAPYQDLRQLVQFNWTGCGLLTEQTSATEDRQLQTERVAEGRDSLPESPWEGDLRTFADSVDVYCDTDLDLDTQGHHEVDPFVSYCLCGLLQEKKCSRECRVEINALILCRQRRFKARSKYGAQLLNLLGRLLIALSTVDGRKLRISVDHLVRIGFGKNDFRRAAELSIGDSIVAEAASEATMSGISK